MLSDEAIVDKTVYTENEDEEPAFQPVSEEDQKIFDMNRRVRLGRSKDQDGKSNIWSVEPTMEVVEDEEGGSSLQRNLVIGAILVGTSIASLPFFNFLTTLLPDPADF